MDLLDEQWLQIRDYAEYYISDRGRVFSKKRMIMLKPGKKNGYLFVILYQKGSRKNHYVHRLVCKAFCLNENNYLIVDHIDRTKVNNHFSNLRWVTSSINNKNASLSKSNKSGKTGVYFDKSNDSWVACWNNSNQKQKAKSFSTNKYPNAQELAIDYRQKMEKKYNYI